MLIHNAVLTGSFSYAGADLSNISASADYSASLSTRTTNLETASGSFSTRLTAVSSSQQQISSSQQQISASLLNVIATGATTGSNSFRADQSITGSLVVSSTITAQTLVVQTVTSSIVYSSGSNNFGNQLANTQTFTGSVNITGSLALAGNITGNAITLTGALGGTTADFLTTVGTRYLQIRDAGTSTPSLRSVNDTIAQLRAIAIEANTISLRTGASSGLTVTEALGISATGVATFSGNVNVYDGSSRGLSISNSSGAITFSNNWGKTTFTSPSAQDIEFNDDAGVKRLFLKNGGNVGIGTTNPTGSLDVSGSIYIRSTGGGVLYIPRMADPSHGLSIGEQNIIGSKSAVIRTGGGVSEHLFIDPGFNDSNVAGNIALAYANTGSVGIGTYLPGAKLEVAGARNSTLLRLTATSGENWDFKNTNTVGSTDVLSIGAVGATVNLSLKDDGSVGIGTTSPSYTLDAQGTTGAFFSYSNASTYFRIRPAAANGTVNLQYGANSGAAPDLIFSNDANSEKLRITNGGTIFNRQSVGATLTGGYSLIGTIGPGNTGNRYLHARINTIGSMMVWIKIFGYSYAGGILEGIGGGYVDGATGTIAQNFNNGSIPIIHQNAGYIEVVVDTIQTGTSNRWGSITFLGGTDTIATVQPLEIMTWSWTSTTTRVY